MCFDQVHALDTLLHPLVAIIIKYTNDLNVLLRMRAKCMHVCQPLHCGDGIAGYTDLISEWQ